MGKANRGAAGGPRRIDAAARLKFLAALRKGARLQDAAAAGGFSIAGFYRVRDRDSLFAAAWKEALEISAAPRFISPSNRRLLQGRAIRRLRFDEKRQGIFLDHFAGNCDAMEAARAAGVSEPTVYRCRQRDPVFAEAWQAALETGHARLEAELLRQRLAAQTRLRDEVEPTGEMAAEFERVLKLLARYDRKDGGVGPRTISHGNRERWTFEDAIAALDKKLRAVGARRLPPPDGPPDAAPDPEPGT